MLSYLSHNERKKNSIEQKINFFLSLEISVSFLDHLIEKMLISHFFILWSDGNTLTDVS